MEYCRSLIHIEDLREATFIPYMEESRNTFDLCVVSTQQHKQQADCVVRAHGDLLNSVSEIHQLIGEETFERSRYSIPPDSEGPPIENDFDNNSLFRVRFNDFCFFFSCFS